MELSNLRKAVINQGCSCDVMNGYRCDVHEALSAYESELIKAVKRDGYKAAVARLGHYASESNGLLNIRILMDAANDLKEDMEDALE